MDGLRKIPKIRQLHDKKKGWLKIFVSKYANYAAIKELMYNLSKIRQLHNKENGWFKKNTSNKKGGLKIFVSK